MRAMILCIILITLVSCAALAEIRSDDFAVCPFVFPAPTIDGKLDDACWKAAPQIPEIMYRDTFRPASPKTSVALACDDQGLYIAFRCAEPEVAKIVGSNADKIWLNDSLEVYLDADRDRSIAQHFLVDAQGRKLQEMMQDGNVMEAKWAAPWEAAVKQGQNEWTAEVFIPWKTMGIEYQPGAAIRASFGRNRRVDGSVQAWYATPDGFNKPLRFSNVFIVRRHTEAKGILALRSDARAGKADGWLTIDGMTMDIPTFTPVIQVYPSADAKPLVLRTVSAYPISTTDIPISLDMPSSSLYNVDIWAQDPRGEDKWLMQSYQVQLPFERQDG